MENSNVSSFINYVSGSTVSRKIPFTTLQMILSNISYESVDGTPSLVYTADGVRTEFPNMTSKSYGLKFILHWIYKKSYILVTDVPPSAYLSEDSIQIVYHKNSVEESNVVQIVDYSAHGIYFTSGDENSDFPSYNESHTGILIVDSISVKELLSEEVYSQIQWNDFRAFYSNDSKSEVVKVIQRLNSENISHIAVITDLSGMKVTSTEIAEIQEDYEVVDIYTLDSVKEFLKNHTAHLSFKELIGFISNLALELNEINKEKSVLLYLPFDVKVEESLRKAICVGLAYTRLTQNSMLLMDSNSVDTLTYFDSIVNLNSMKPLTMAHKIMREQLIYSAAKSPTDLYFCIAKTRTGNSVIYLNDAVNNTTYHLVDWNMLKNTLRYTEKDADIVLSYGDSDKVIPFKLPVYESKLPSNDNTNREVILTQTDIDNGFEILDLMDLGIEESILTGKDTKWTKTDYNLSEEEIYVQLFEESKIRYAFWDGICRLMEQLVTLKCGDTRKPYSTYVTLRDLVVLREKATGKIFLAYVDLDYSYSVISATSEYSIRTNLPSIEFADAYAFKDFIEDEKGQLSRCANSVLDLCGQENKDKNLAPLYLDGILGLSALDIQNDSQSLQALYYALSRIGIHIIGHEGLDVFEREMADTLNLDTYKNLKKLKDIITPYGSRYSQSIISIFGGFCYYSYENSNRYEFEPNTHTGSVLYTHRHLIKYS